jgi:hypothetical protein
VSQGFASQTADLQQWQNSAGTVLATVGAKGSLYVTTSDPTWVVAQFRGAASHTADLTQWQNSAGTLRACVTANGALRTPYVEHITATNAYLDISAATNGISVINRSATGNIPLVVKGMASQTGDLQRWQDSAGTTVAALLPSGAFTPYYISTTSATAQLGYPGTYPNLLTAWSAAGPGLVVKAKPSQTYNLQEWWDSADVMMFAIDAGGFPKWTAAKAQTTVGAAGGASALPATPTKYLQVKDSAGTTFVIPAYAAA